MSDRLLPKIVFTDIMPGYMNSAWANYCPPHNIEHPNEIWIKRGRGFWKTVYSLFHELVHWAIEMTTHSKKVHNMWDWRPCGR